MHQAPCSSSYATPDTGLDQPHAPAFLAGRYFGRLVKNFLSCWALPRCVLAQITGQTAFIEPNVHQRRDGADDTEGEAVQQIGAHRQAADVAAWQAVASSAAVEVGWSPSRAFSDQLLKQVGNRTWHIKRSNSKMR